jgi:hypothetical protein
MSTNIHFSASELESSLSNLEDKGITEFVLQDETILSHKGKLLSFLKLFEKKAPEVFLTLPVSAEVLDMDVCRACTALYCTLEIPLHGQAKGNSYLFDKKFYSRRARMLNTLGLVFGFDLDFALEAGDGIKLFLERLDFALSLYPNHIDFVQLEKECAEAKALQPHPSSTFSTQDIKRAFHTAVATSIFYSYGRAVTWFLSVLHPLKINASKFFEDFWEWSEINHYALEKNYSSLKANHKEIEKMQLAFLKFKYEEKNKGQLFEAVSSIVRLNGALSRCFGENEESIVEMSYNPDEILSGAAMNIQSFFDNSFMEYSTVKVFMGKDGPEYKYC